MDDITEIKYRLLQIEIKLDAVLEIIRCLINGD